MMLNQELEFFESKKEELYETHKDRFVVIVGNKVHDDYDTRLKAYLDAQKQFEPGTFLIKECSPDATSSVTTHQTRVYFDK